MPMPYLYENSVENDIKIFEIPTTRKFSSKRVRKFKIWYVIINFPTIGFTYSFANVKNGNFEKKNSVVLYPLLFIHTPGGICVFLQ